jgi:chromate reductase, NAD(P)H dehydrogenase (quinone)
MMRVLAIAGSLRHDSYNRRLLQAAAAEAAPEMALHIWDGLAFVPPFNEDLEAAPPPSAVADLRRAIEAADTVLIATPEYNGSVPGQLKNALDWVSRPFRSNPFRDLPVAVIGASPSPRGAASAQAELQKVLRVIGARVVGPEFAVSRVHERFGADGRLSDDVVRARLRELLADLALAATHVVVAAAA